MSRPLRCLGIQPRQTVFCLELCTNHPSSAEEESGWNAWAENHIDRGREGHYAQVRERVVVGHTSQGVYCTLEGERLADSWRGGMVTTVVQGLNPSTFPGTGKTEHEIEKLRIED